MLQYSILLSFLVYIVSAQSQEWEVTTEYGDVRGHWSEQYQVWRFDGIPYASAPVEALRFKEPVPPAPWDGVLYASNNTVTCHQHLAYSVRTESEDCLVINVFVPESARTQGPLPVLFFIHGGGFTFGSGNNYNPHLTTRHDVILVTFNYRLGPFGYTCLGTEHAPGNAGFKDIIFALRWTNRNIHSFGGDSNAVTIYGESAGGYQAHALVFSKAAEGLFARAIVESGAAMCYFGHSYDRLGKAKAAALHLGFTIVDDLDRLADFLVNAAAEDLIQSTSEFGFSRLCVEQNINGVEAAVSERFDLALSSGNYNKVPIMFALTELENMLFSPNFTELIDELNNNFEEFLPLDIFIPTESEKDEAIRRIKEVYFGGELITEDSLRSFIEYQSDERYYIGIYRSILQHSLNSDSPVYLMEFTYRGGFNQPNPYPEIAVASHADIVAHVMDLGYYNNDTLQQDQLVRDRMTELWTNFVKYGNPTPADSSLGVEWPAFSADDQSYLNVNEQLSVRQRLHPARMQLWMDLYQRYFYPPPTFENSGKKITFSYVLVMGLVTLLFV